MSPATNIIVHVAYGMVGAKVGFACGTMMALLWLIFWSILTKDVERKSNLICFAFSFIRVYGCVFILLGTSILGALMGWCINVVVVN